MIKQRGIVMKKIKVVVSVLLVLIITLLSVATTFAATISVFNDKISDQLKVIVSEDKLELIPVYIFLSKCDKSVVYENLEEKYNYDTEVYENKELYYKEVVPNITVDNKKVSEILKGKKVTEQELSLDNDDSSLDIKTRERINRAMVDDTNEYLGDYREEISNVVDEYVSEFVQDNKRFIEKIIFQPNSAEFVIAQVTPDSIGKLARISNVSRIGYFMNQKQEIESWSASSLIGSNSSEGLGSSLYNSGLGYDGTGVTIGIIEAGSGRYDEDDENLSEANLTFIPTPGVENEIVTEHATHITSLICGKQIIIDGKIYEGAARGSCVYQTAIYDEDDVLSAIRMFANKGVKIINYSGGGDTGLGYSEFDQAVDILLENNRLLLVKSSGKEGQESRHITSPGKAYNALTVGNLIAKESNNIELDAPFEMPLDACFEEASYLANKPDVVAPGTELYLPVTDTECVRTQGGASYAAPLVTAMAAQIMQSDCLAIFNPNAAKNYILCGASNKEITGTSVSYGALMDESGAGLVNAVKSYECSNLGTEYYGVYLASQIAPTEYETIATYRLAKGNNIRVVLTFEKEEDIYLLTEYGNNIDIRLVRDNPYSTYCVASESTNNNVELIDTKVPSTGTYLLQIRLTNSILNSSINNDLHYWVSWRIY